MNLPSATYRLQFREGMTFDRAIDLVPHLADLGISHLYASPIFTATTGSSHGYDIVDANAIDPALGGRDGFDRLVVALKLAGIGLILDIVPNHMAASVENAWWKDVLRHGKGSPYADCFDIDWSERLTLPVLVGPLDEAIAAGQLEVIRSGCDGTVNLKYLDTLFPLNPDSLSGLDPALLESRVGEATQTKSGDKEQITQLLARQHWQLISWKEAARHLNYRRFFEVTGLVGVRVEDENVFRDTHRLIIELVEAGQVQGLRIDHIDGLADPTGYLGRLREAVGTQIYVIVEKILANGEALPSDWPVAGTTGYEFISALSQLLIDPSGLRYLEQEYEMLDAGAADFQKGLRDAKRLMVARNFEGEVERLTGLAHAVTPDIDRLELKEGVRELLIAFPVYRTYGYQGTLSDRDETVLATAIEQARQYVSGSSALDRLNRLLNGEIDGTTAFEFRSRFQQLSGPVMAKALEDTLFYRYNRLLAANEVGGDVAGEPGGIKAFHDAMRQRRVTQPTGLSATSTHDTKRGEDARARLYTLSEEPRLWGDAVKRWHEMNKRFLSVLPDGHAPEPNVEWMLYQSLAGVWPTVFDPVDLSHAGLKSLRHRFTRYAEKAVREAKFRTDWSEPRADYEKAITAYAGALLSPDNPTFMQDFGETIKPFVAAGCVNTLAQTLIKLTAAGVPDIYQGAEGFDLSLVDPDNRQPLDFQGFRGKLARDQAWTPNGRKHDLIQKVLRLRREYASLFAYGDYRPLDIGGLRSENVVAFGRSLHGMFAITVAPRLVFGCVDTTSARISSDFWKDTVVTLPTDLSKPMRDLRTGQLSHGMEMRVADILAAEDVSVLISSR